MGMKKIFFSLFFITFSICLGASEQAMINVYGRDFHLLNGKWNVIVDLYDQGRRMEVYKNRVPQTKEEFYEYSFENGIRLNVPGDWNSQSSELKYYEGTVWYGRHFVANLSPDKRQFLYFGAVSYRCRVYLNGKEVASHEGGFTPFQVEVTDVLLEGDNFLVVEVNNTRSVDAIPAMAFDWWNYGGITRDVMLVTTPRLFIRDYFVRLDSVQKDLIHATVTLSAKGVRDVRIEIPELNIERTLQTNEEGVGRASLKVRKLELWEPEKARLYKVVITSEENKIEEEIGFRQITVNGTSILVNGNPVFMRSVSFHEEIPQRMGRAFSEADASMLLNEAKALGVNMIRLAHYPQNEYIVRMAEKMGIILWQEIPIWQGIDFEDRGTLDKARTMLREMINRDKNRCAVCFWGVANETKPSDARNAFLLSLLKMGRSMDCSRLYVAAFDLVYFNKNTRHFEMDDPFTANLDVVAVNKYMGWYHPWPLSLKKQYGMLFQTSRLLFRNLVEKPCMVNMEMKKWLLHGVKNIRLSCIKIILRCLIIFRIFVEFLHGYCLIFVLLSVFIRLIRVDGIEKDCFPIRDYVKRHGTSCMIIIKRKNILNDEKYKSFIKYRFMLLHIIGREWLFKKYYRKF